MVSSFTLTAELRQTVGTASSRQLRRENKVPAVLYGKGQEPLSIAISHNALWNALEDPAFYSHILILTIGEKSYQVVLESLQKHPFKPKILHLDLLSVSNTEKISLTVPLRFVGEAIAPGVKQGGGIISHLLNSVKVQCLPGQLPEFIEVDLSKLGLNEHISLSQLSVPEGVELVALKENPMVVNLRAPRVNAKGGTSNAEGDAASTDSNT